MHTYRGHGIRRFHQKRILELHRPKKKTVAVRLGGPKACVATTGSSAEGHRTQLPRTQPSAWDVLDADEFWPALPVPRNTFDLVDCIGVGERYLISEVEDFLFPQHYVPSLV